jgi:spore maturation protein CgeB
VCTLKILVLDSYNPSFLAAHYGARPGLAGAPYDEQIAALMKRSFGTFDAYSAGLRRLGHDAAEVVVNSVTLQRRWAGEHGTRLKSGPLTKLPGPLGGRAARRALAEVAREQIEDFKPDVVYVQELEHFSPRQLRTLRDGVPLLVGQIASAGPGDRTYRECDLLISSFPHYVDRFRSLGMDAEYMPLAFDDRLLERLGNPTAASAREHEITLVGGLSPTTYRRATPLLERLARDFDIDVWGFGAESLDPSSPILRRFHGEIWGLDMYRVFADSKIVLNRHGEVSAGYANNMRLFEATGAGALVFTEDAPNLGELFEPGAEIVAYSDEEDLRTKLAHYSADDDARRTVAAAGQARTLRDHTYSRRMEQLAGLLEERL